jgi:glutamate-1-semialdehyde 2,1-aminomutase
MPERKITAREKDLMEKAHRYLPGGSTGNLPTQVILHRGQGSRVWDVSGNEYIDYLLGSGPMVVGHGHPEVVAAVQEQLQRGTTFFATNEHAILLAEEIVNAVPSAEKVRFTGSGTEASLYALRIARAFRKRDKILKFEGGFHGMNDYALMSVTPSEPLDFPHPKADSAGIPRSVENEVLIAPFNDIETTSTIIERYHDELGAVIVEPFQRVIAPRPGFLEGLRDVTRRYEIPLIFDEVVTGFRFGYGGAQEYYGVTPDLCTLGKACAGGYPLAAVAGSEELMASTDPGTTEGYVQQIGTLNGNPIAAVAGLATLKILRREGAYESLFATGRQVRDGLQQLLDHAEIPAQVVGESTVFDVYFGDQEITDYRSTLSNDKQMVSRLNRLSLERGVFRGSSKYYVSTAHTQEDVDRTLEAFGSAIEELRG